MNGKTKNSPCGGSPEGRQKGVVAIFSAILVLIIMFIIINGINFLVFGQQKIYTNTLQSIKSYYAAEGGAEDALLRLRKNTILPSMVYNLNVGQSVASVDISDLIGGVRTIFSEGNNANRIRKIKIIYKMKNTGIGFYYGAQVGDGGLDMGNNSRVKGNVYSNGSVISSPGPASIDYSVVVARNYNKVSGLSVGENALAYRCENSTIYGNLTYVSDLGFGNCVVSGMKVQRGTEIPPEPLPISQQQIDEWKQEAADVQIIPNDVVFNTSFPPSEFGAVQIGTPAQRKNLTLGNGAYVRLRGTVYVTGDIFFEPGSKIDLDPSYGSFSGVIVADGAIRVNNTVIIEGSGQPGSYVLILSTNSDSSLPAIDVKQNVDGQGAIFYAGSGIINFSNNAFAREITGYKVRIDNLAEIQYESGLQNSLFSNGPGGSWVIDGWQEIY